MGFLMFPFALLALAAVPTLGAIYWLRNRFRRMTVSSLVLWMDQTRPQEGGRRMQRIQTPLVFFLELLAILFLVAAAIGPMVPSRDLTRHLIVVLDNSYSMVAGDNPSPRTRALQEIKNEIGRHAKTKVSFILAGDQPQVLASNLENYQEAKELLNQWSCRSVQSDLPGAILLARDLATKWTDILVLTDHKPDTPPGEADGLKWLSLGEPWANVAIVNASRTTVSGKERVLLEVANLSTLPTDATLYVESLTNEADTPILRQQKLSFSPDQTQKIVLDLKENAPVLRFRLIPDREDALELDNQVVLVSDRENPIRTALHIKDEVLEKLLIKGLEATAAAEMVSEKPEIIFTDQDGQLNPFSDVWRVRFIEGGEEAQSYLGPFVMNRTHALTEGLQVEGAIWGASPITPTAEATPVGAAVIMAGDIPLLSDQQQFSGAHDITLNFTPQLSTVQDSVNWPILMSNIVQWRQTAKAGPDQANVRLSNYVSIRLAIETSAIRIMYPDGQEEMIELSDSSRSRYEMQTQQTGLYRLTAFSAAEGEEAASDRVQSWSFAVNTLHKSESELGSCVTDEWGGWHKSESAARAYQNIAWLFLLGTLLALAGHMAYVTWQCGGQR